MVAAGGEPVGGGDLGGPVGPPRVVGEAGREGCCVEAAAHRGRDQHGAAEGGGR